MSSHDQCPSTKPGQKNETPRQAGRTPHEQVGIGPTGRKYWRSLDDLADTPQFREWLEREFPPGASELLGDSRRTFLKLMAASVALAGAATIPGCRRPDLKIMPYSKTVPEDSIPGKPLYYATSMPLPGGGAEGLLIETHDGRPTKVEGNPLHPINRGKTSIWAQAAVLGLYDPDRQTDPVFTEAGGADADKKPRSWEDFAAWSEAHFKAYDAAAGEGLAFLVDKKSSPSRDSMRDRIKRKWPKAMWVAYDPVDSDAAAAGGSIAFGRPMREAIKFDRAKVIVSLDRDFTNCESMGLVYARDFASTRRVMTVDDAMSRLYVVESGFSGVGAKADHRWRLAPSQVSAFGVALGKAVAARTGGGGPVAAALKSADAALPAGMDQKIIDAIADDLTDKAHLGKSVIVAGATQTAAIHALVHAINAALGNIGNTVWYVPVDAEEASGSADGIRALAEKMDAGSISTIVCQGVNPVYDAPADLGFKDKFKKVKVRIAQAVDHNETVRDSQWRLPLAHFLEAWGDTRAAEGTVAPIQPMIAPLYASKSDIETLAIISGDELRDGHDIVRRAWKSLPALQGVTDAAAFDKAWRRALHDGVLANSTPAPAKPTLAAEAVAAAVKAFRPAAAPTKDSLEAVFTTWNIGDGRFANCGWLQELCEPSSKIVWDNAALVSPATAEALGLKPQPATQKDRKARVASVTLNGRSARIPVFELPGMPDNTVILPLGYGRTVCGLVGTGVGHDLYQVRDAASRSVAAGVKLAPVSDGEQWYPLSTTQTHGSMEGRALVREVDRAAWQKYGSQILPDPDSYGRNRDLNFAERLGELSHAPANVSIYVNPLNGTSGNPAPADATNSLGQKIPFAQRPNWGMSVDLSTCTGCNVCTIACQAENNIPIVGKAEVNKGREMAWIRVDRYFAGDSEHTADGMLFQPVACVQCENAPCETVCPVNATVHGPEGINYMVYNRCIGTRYCANNCPYKVRRFNFFAYGIQRYNGSYIGEDLMPGGGPSNKNLIPPTLREKLPDITRLHMNPDVTIRSRGVMEKCTYCIQRINEARIETKLSDLKHIPDGEVVTACQQACPTDSIVFGDILDTVSDSGKGSRVRQMRENGRSYLLLGFLDTRPRTTYMLSVKNPNPAIRTPVVDPFQHHGGGHDGHDGHGSEGEHEMDHHGEKAAVPHASRDRGVKFSLPVLGGRSLVGGMA
ncbi:MAG: TAT-variant-translocated molybdopterin oxidoreductase [Phycisphaeraceae bacterium]|nr:TAT-variant-translocated molybdopterin oxidoreductase [Phycisphaeraceae bacterium]